MHLRALQAAPRSLRVLQTTTRTSNHLLHATPSHAEHRWDATKQLHATHQHAEPRLESRSLHTIKSKSKRSSEVMAVKRHSISSSKHNELFYLQLLLSKYKKAHLHTKNATLTNMGDKDKQQDIRKWLSPPRGSSSNTTPSRRRRVMSTSDSEDERTHYQPGGVAAENVADMHVPNATDTLPQIHDENVVVLETSSDDMFICPPVRERSEASHEQQSRQGNTAGSLRNSARNTSRRPRPEAQPRRPQRRMRQAEAAESSAETDDDSSCIESDTNARSQYRDAILGVRNANRARQQMRANTQRCPICAQFAAYLIHFM